MTRPAHGGDFLRVDSPVGASLGGDLFPGLAFSGNPLDRVSEKRDDEAFVAARAAREDARTVLIARDAPTLRQTDGAPSPYFALPDLAAIGRVTETALLGVRASGAPVFAAALADDAVAAVGEKEATVSYDARQLAIADRPDLALRDMRSLAVDGLLDGADVAILAQAKALLGWHARHRFCSACGAPTRVAAAGWRRECAACRAQHFPRTDPVVIMLVVDGDRCLLGRQSRFPRGMYSALAGFVEAGETIEEAVRREIWEEAGVRCGPVRYLASQPWPFPTTLMIGCLARAATTELTIDQAELEDARWFSRDEVIAMRERRHPDAITTPHPVAIAHHLIAAWIDGRAMI
jgi:NAD+ diphosphatase